MRLLLPSAGIVVYLFLSLVLPLSVRPRVKALLGLLLTAAGLKYIFYELFGGSFFNPALPVPLLIAMEALYAALVILFFLCLIKDAAALLFLLARRMGREWRLPFTAGLRNTVLVLSALGCAFWGSVQAVRVPEVRTVEVTLPGLPRALDGFRLVQLTDIHIGPLLKRPWLEAVVEKTNALSPDAVVITGDFIDGLPHELADEVRPLTDLRARCGVFGILGNHEYYYDAPGWMPLFRSMGIDILDNTHRVLPGGLVLGGVNDHAARAFGLETPNVDKAFSHAPDGPRILLSHRPYLPGTVPNKKTQLQLSGHTHGGLLFFLSPLIAQFNGGYVNGLYRAGGGFLYVSPGTGLWSGFSCRVGVPSEITRLILRSPLP